MSRKARILILPALLAPLLTVAACEFPHQPGSDEEDPVAKTVRARHERNAYSVPPRDYPSQTNTNPVGWQPPQAQAQTQAQVQAAAGAVPPSPPPQAMASAASQPAAAMRPPPPMPGNKPQAPAGKPAAEAMGPNPPLPAGYVPSVPAPAGANAMVASTAMAAMPQMPSGAWHAHLASHRSEEAAINDWQRRLKENPAVYGELEPDLLWVDIPNRGSYARLVFGSFASKADAQAACGKISGPGRYCNAIQEKP